VSSTPRELVDCAAELLKRALDEPQYRAVCSRAYYGAFHAANAFHNALSAPGSVGTARGRHQQLISQLANPACSKQNDNYFISQALSKKLRPLIDARVKADYLIRSEVSVALATAATAGAEAIVQRVI
jgi:uncharacterized protein (UPF0332 family)